MEEKYTNTLVVGAGISGIRTALDLAGQGYKVTLIDRAPAIGGILSKLDAQFPSNHCGMCRMLPLSSRDKGGQHCLRKGLFHENITLKLGCELTGLSGEPGDFTARLREKATWVDPDRCVGCGLCEQVCPVDIKDEFNEGLCNRKAIYLPVPHAIPNAFVIDPAACTRCGECEKICPVDAVQLSRPDRKGFRILVVDDELSIRDSLKEWLEEEGFSVDMAASGKEALDMLEKNPCHLMLTDIKMPGMQGTQLLEQAKEAFPDLVVVMMTAYATVETAVTALKNGARDYLLKPFDPETLLPMVVEIFEDLQAAKDLELATDSVVLSFGTTFFDPADERNLFGYGVYPNVLTHLEFERLISGTGPFAGKILRRDNSRPVKRIAWLQCIGSRDVQSNADFCSAICCMIAVKQAMLASDHNIETAIFYMDMRAFGKSFYQYCRDAENEKHVRFIRCRIHSVTMDNTSGNLDLAYLGPDGTMVGEQFDMVVLSTGQRPGRRAARMADLCGIEVNGPGFTKALPFAPVNTSREGVLAAGSVTGLKDIAESVIHASAAGLNAAALSAAAGKKPVDPEQAWTPRDIGREQVSVCAVVCSCGRRLDQVMAPELLKQALLDDPVVSQVIVADRLCTAQGFEKAAAALTAAQPNRVLIGACHPYLFLNKVKDLARQMDLPLFSFHAVDIAKGFWHPERATGLGSGAAILPELYQGCAMLKYTDPCQPVSEEITRRALVIGGGIAGMTAALGLAYQGFEVDLVEKSDRLGGNLQWLTQTLDKEDFKPLLDSVTARVNQHPKVDLFTQSQVLDVTGRAGCFSTVIEDKDNHAVAREHGAVILATGGVEAPVHSYAADHDCIVTQKALEMRCREDLDFASELNSVVMILCVDSRDDTKNYCSRVCCPTALKQARMLKEKNPDLDIYILYRDMMTCGFAESHFTKARSENIIFISYKPGELPDIVIGEDAEAAPVVVKTLEPVLGLPIEIEADLAVLATGVAPVWPEETALSLGVEKDEFGFFKEADSKWRPVDAKMAGVFACGLLHSPRSVEKSIATAQAAACRAVALLSAPALEASHVTAVVRHSLCSLCQRCIAVCPYGARSLDGENEAIYVSPVMCQGCGACAAACPNGASMLQGYSGTQMLARIDAAVLGVN